MYAVVGAPGTYRFATAGPGPSGVADCAGTVAATVAAAAARQTTAPTTRPRVRAACAMGFPSVPCPRSSESIPRSRWCGDVSRVTLLPHPLVRRSFASPVPPGTGWPDDPATRETPTAHGAD